ncbi:MAG: NAD+ synthase [bacterium]
MHELRVGIAQINCLVGDFEGNYRKIIQSLQKGSRAGADLVCFPELAICGYPPEDLLHKQDFVNQNRQSLDKLIKESEKFPGTAVAVGFVDQQNGSLYNAAAFVQAGKLVSRYHKILLPNYGVFDEKRYFQPGKSWRLVNLKGINLGINICEDIWFDEGPTASQVAAGARLIVNLNASPFHTSKDGYKQELLAQRSRNQGVFLVYNNLVGGQDELVFDGGSFVFDPQGRTLLRCQRFSEDFRLCNLNFTEPEKAVPAPVKDLSTEAEVYEALKLGVRDYVDKNGFKKVLLGLSGGIDSALTAVIARDALGSGRVETVFMPSRYTSQESRRDAYQLAENLGIALKEIPIDQLFEGYLNELAPSFKGLPPGIAEENIQARIRGNILMAFSNKFGCLVLTTGNKSEMSVGYATLYGDMAGGFAVIKDVPKTMVYRLADFVNASSESEVIPAHIITRPPSAELRENQADSDSLPPYEELDPILELYVEHDLGMEEIIRRGYNRETVEKVIRLVDRAEYKRRQAPIGIKITPKAFGRDRRLPVTRWMG